MKKITRRQLFRGAGAAAVGGAALAVGLTPASKAVLAGSCVGKSWTKPIYLPSNVICFGETRPEIFRLWSKKVLEEIRKATFIPNLSGDLGA